jgi:hypothetical protein
VSGSELFTISGGPFVQSNYTVLITSVVDPVGNPATMVPAVWLSEEEISFTSPARASGPHTLVVYLNGVPYTSDDLSFSYLELPAAVNVPVAASLSTIFGLLFIAGIIALIIMRRRKVGFFNAFKLKEPDYAQVAFGALLTRTFDSH